MKNKKELIKKIFFLFIVLILVSIFSIKILSAASSNVYMEKFIDWVNSNYGPLFGAILGHESLDEFLFTKVLILILIFSIVFMSINRTHVFGDNRVIIFVVSLIVAILSVRYIKSDSFLTGIILPYGVLGVAITVFLPMLIYFLFVHTSVGGSFGRRFAWFVYGVVFLVIWLMRREEIGDANWIYFIGLIFVILCFIFDRTIHYYFDLPTIYRANRAMIRRNQMMLLEDLRRAEELYAQTGDIRWRIEADDIRRRLRRLGYRGAL